MPKTRGTEYRDRTGVEEEAEDRDEQVEDEDKEKTEFSSDDRDSSFRAANQHIVKLTDELRGINEKGRGQLRPPEEPGGVRHERKEGDGGGRGEGLQPGRLEQRLLTPDNRGEVAFIMVNPATTSEERDLGPGSPTRNRCIKIAKDEGYGTLTEVNLFAYRAPGRDALYQTVAEEEIDAVGPENDRVIRDAVTDADLVVVAWGNTNGNRRSYERVKGVAEFLRSLDKRIYCPGKNRTGSPKSPARGPNRLTPGHDHG